MYIGHGWNGKIYEPGKKYSGIVWAKFWGQIELHPRAVGVVRYMHWIVPGHLKTKGRGCIKVGLLFFNKIYREVISSRD